MTEKLIPPPIDTSAIHLNDSLLQLQEKLARNTHNVWAAKRLAEGWRPGPCRDEARKETPCLVPYEDLPENEKDYDRQTALETIRIILRLGYALIEPEQPVPGNQGEAAKKQLVNTGKATLAEYKNIWQQKDSALWENNPELYSLLGENILKAGEPLFAFDVFSQGLKQFDRIDSLDQVKGERKSSYIDLCRGQALALAQSGAAADAGRLLSRLISQGVNDADTKGLLGRTFKDLSLKDSKIDREQAKAAFAIYHEAFQEAKARQDDEASYYDGINAATISFLLGDREQSVQIATEVNFICHRVSDQLRSNSQAIPFWLDATMGEVALLSGNLETAKSHYAEAARKNQDDLRSLGAMQKQAKLILRAAGQRDSLLDTCFQLPKVCVFSWPERGSHLQEEQLRLFFEEEIRTVRGRIGYSSAITMAEILFLEEILRQKGEVNIVLPVEKENVLKQCFETKDHELKKRFLALCDQAASLRVLDQFQLEKFSHSLKFCSLYLQGTAMTRAEQIGTECINLLEKSPWLKKRQEQGKDSVWAEERARESHTWNISIDQEGVEHSLFRPMLFADVKGYSTLTERELLRFATSFLGKVADITDRYGSGLLSKKTMGDGLFIVFQELSEAVNFAKDLQAMIHAEDWQSHGLPEGLTIRISLDAGPCYRYHDPVMDRSEFCGSYVIRAARMEPITPPGHIYASDTFVALCRAGGVDGVRFDYAGQVSLPKNYGIIPAYHVR